MKTYKAISRTSGKEFQVTIGLVEKTTWVNIGGENIEKKTGTFEIDGFAYIPQIDLKIDTNVQIYMFNGKLVFKAKNDKINVDAFVENAVEIENYFAEKESKRIKEEKEYKAFQREFNM